MREIGCALMQLRAAEICELWSETLNEPWSQSHNAEMLMCSDGYSSCRGDLGSGRVWTLEVAFLMSAGLC